MGPYCFLAANDLANAAATELTAKPVAYRPRVERIVIRPIIHRNL
jgi:hypothetical protein